MQIHERLFEFIESSDIKAIALSKHLNIPQSTIANWKQRGTDPPAKYITSICDFFNLNVNWLLTGRGDKYKNGCLMTKRDNEESANYRLDSSEELLIEKYRELSKEGQKKAVGAILDIWKNEPTVKEKTS